MTLPLREQANEIFAQNFTGSPETTVMAPGRVNLIGEHTDYNEGFVFPMAVNLGIAIAGRKRSDSRILLYSADYKEMEDFSISAIRPDMSRSWANYFKGVVLMLKKNGLPIGGCEAVLTGDLPQGAGLSSSAALEVAAAVLFQKLFHLGLEDLELVRLAQQAENEFVGVQCGIMDQFASYMGGKDHALFIDCRSLEHDWVPLGHGNTRWWFSTPGSRRGACLLLLQRAPPPMPGRGAAIDEGFLPSIPSSLRDVALPL